MKKLKLLILIAVLAVPCFTSASLSGDYYDNRDGDHAKLNVDKYTDLTYMQSGRGAGTTVIPDKIVFGNASLAYTSGWYWGSTPRYSYLRSSLGANRAYNLYINNNTYWYPEHRDHDEVDYFFAMSSAVNVSQGSSGSELDEMYKWFDTLDAFSTDTKAFLKSEKLVIPTMAMIARRTRVANDTDYMSYKAHPNAFDNYSNQADMMTMASNMKATEIPPMVQIKVVDEDYNKTANGTLIFEAGSINREKRFDTPVSIARAWHSSDYQKRMVVSAESSYDANGKELTYHWVIIRGTANDVKITPLNDAKSKVELIFTYHDETTIKDSTRLTNLVTVGSFVNNGSYYSAPAFVNSYTKRNETRTYDANDRLRSMEYNTNKIDPSISFEKKWQKDEFSYDSGGELSGFTRTQDGSTYDFTKEGYFIESRDASGKPNMAKQVIYRYYTTDYKTVWETYGEVFAYPKVVVTYDASDDPYNDEGNDADDRDEQTNEDDNSDEQTNEDNEGTSTDDTVAPTPEEDYNGQVGSLDVQASSAEVKLTWVNPTDDDFAGVRVERVVEYYSNGSVFKGSGTVYHGDAESFIDKNVTSGMTYTYHIKALGSDGTYTQINKVEVKALDTVNLSSSGSNNTSTVNEVNTLVNVDNLTAEQIIKAQSAIVYGHSTFVPLDNVEIKLYDELVIAAGIVDENTSKQYDLAYFIAEGTQTTTRLGAGERAAVLNSYLYAYKHLPEREEDWQDVIKIANGRWPSERNVQLEETIKQDVFQTVYRRTFNQELKTDETALMLMTYGLLPPERDFSSEDFAIGVFFNVYEKYPEQGSDWNIVRAISYSGATR